MGGQIENCVNGSQFVPPWAEQRALDGEHALSAKLRMFHHLGKRKHGPLFGFLPDGNILKEAPSVLRCDPRING
jgi:hypothetical protein